jgi:hypothetical protein
VPPRTSCRSGFPRGNAGAVSCSRGLQKSVSRAERNGPGLPQRVLGIEVARSWRRISRWHAGAVGWGRDALISRTRFSYFDRRSCWESVPSLGGCVPPMGVALRGREKIYARNPKCWANGLSVMPVTPESLFEVVPRHVRRVPVVAMPELHTSAPDSSRGIRATASTAGVR